MSERDLAEAIHHEITSPESLDATACTGKGLNPEGVALRRYEVRVEGDEILVNVDKGLPIAR